MPLTVQVTSGFTKQGGALTSPFTVAPVTKRAPVITGLERPVLANFLVGLRPKLQVGAWASINLSKFIGSVRAWVVDLFWLCCF